MTTCIQVRVNGEARVMPVASSLADLVRALGLQSELVAIERNQRLVPRTEFERTALQPDDRLEVVTLVGGG